MYAEDQLVFTNLQKRCFIHIFTQNRIKHTLLTNYSQELCTLSKNIISNVQQTIHNKQIKKQHTNKLFTSIINNGIEHDNSQQNRTSE